MVSPHCHGSPFPVKQYCPCCHHLSPDNRKSLRPGFSLSTLIPNRAFSMEPPQGIFKIFTLLPCLTHPWGLSSHTQPDARSS